MTRLPARGLAAYAALALPLAAVQLPVYIHGPKLYAELGLGLAAIGGLLLALRALDALSDPLLGYLSDRTSSARGGRRLWIALAAPLIALGVVLLFNPPALGPGPLAAWLAASVVCVHLGLSAASVSYMAWGAELSHDLHERTRVTAARGAAGLVGVLLAVALPEWLGATLGRGAGLAWFALAAVPVVAAGTLVTLYGTPAAASRPAAAGSWARSVALPFANRDFRWLAAVFVVNGTAAALPATLVLFYVEDVLRAPQMAGAFLAIYFLCGALAMPLWVRLAAALGKRRAWLAGMAASAGAFVWAYALGPGDAAAFAAVCALSGLAFGADLALPASLLADVADRDERAGGRPDGAYFGIWHLLEKLVLALAAGIGLPLIAALGYVPGTGQGAGALAFAYALVPCAIKLAAVVLLTFSPPESPARIPGAQPEGVI